MQGSTLYSLDSDICSSRGSWPQVVPSSLVGPGSECCCVAFPLLLNSFGIWYNSNRIWILMSLNGQEYVYFFFTHSKIIFLAFIETQRSHPFVLMFMLSVWLTTNRAYWVKKELFWCLSTVFFSFPMSIPPVDRSITWQFLKSCIPHCCPCHHWGDFPHVLCWLQAVRKKGSKLTQR